MTITVELKNINKYSATQLAETRDRLDAEEMSFARAHDAAEAEAVKAGRRILTAHSWMRCNVADIRWARYAAGKKLSARGLAVIEWNLAHGTDRAPHPVQAEAKEAKAVQALADNLAAKSGLWSAFRLANTTVEANAQGVLLIANLKTFARTMAQARAELEPAE